MTLWDSLVDLSYTGDAATTKQLDIELRNNCGYFISKTHFAISCISSNISSFVYCYCVGNNTLSTYLVFGSQSRFRVYSETSKVLRLFACAIILRYLDTRTPLPSSSSINPLSLAMLVLRIYSVNITHSKVVRVLLRTK